MPKPETRIVNQATYTPVERDLRSSFRPEKPFVKQAILTSALPDPAVGRLILERMTEREPGRGAEERRQIAAIVRQFWAGESSTALQELRSIEGEAVLQFARDAMAIERHLLENARHDVDKAIRGLVQSTAPSAPVSEHEQMMVLIKSEIERVREAVVTELRVALSPATMEAYQSETDLPGPDSAFAVAVNTAAGSTLGALPVERNQIQVALSDHSPTTTALLGAMQYFSLPKATPMAAEHEMTHLLAFTEVHAYVVDQKRKLIEALGEGLHLESIGYLHLERLEFTPVGYVRGELVYSLPMLPGEVTRLTHREWSRTETEFTKLISTSIEKAAEEALAEKSELTQSTKTQDQHNSAFNTSVTASGGFGPVHITSSFGYNASTAQQSSRESATKRAQDITKKASSRSKEEHKVTFKVATQYEVEDQSYREVRNETTEAVRWDFHRLMKKWQIDLYRYDVRLTYDLAIPEPGSYLLRKYIQLRNLKKRLHQANPFNLTPKHVTRTNWMDLAQRYKAGLEAPPDEYVTTSAHGQVIYSTQLVGLDFVELTLPDGYEFWSWEGKGSSAWKGKERAGVVDAENGYNGARLNSGAKRGTKFSWRYIYDWSEKAEADQGTALTVAVYAKGKLTNRAFNDWQMTQYARIVDAVNSSFEIERQEIARKIDELEAELGREDALSLRKLEKEEIMKGVLRWVMGPDFRFYPDSLPQLTLSESGDLSYYDKSQQHVLTKGYEAVLKHGEILKFLHQAIEWENVIYVLYPYFWTDDARWDFKQGLYHGDYLHRAFLRAGAARVVLTIRRGFEKALLSFIVTGKLDETLEASHAYMSVADELKKMAETQYPYTQSANKENPDNLVDTWYEFTPTGALDVMKGDVLPEE